MDKETTIFVALNLLQKFKNDLDMVTGNEAAAKAIWDKYLINESRLMFQRILQTSRDNNDEKLAHNFINQLVKSKLTGGAVGNAYSCLIDIHCAKGEFDKASEELNNALKCGPIDHINRTALIRLKNGLEASGKKFKHTISEKKHERSPVQPGSSSSDSSSSGSSSSDDDDSSPKQHHHHSKM